MNDIVFEGLDAFDRFTRFVERLAVLHEAPLIAGAETSSHVLFEEVHKTFGDVSKLAALSPVTQAERSALGYTPNDPLLRDGSLLRNSIERLHSELIAAVGSSEPVMLYSEMGYINARTGNPVPPRPVFDVALKQVQPKVEEILDIAAGVILGFRALDATLLTGTTPLVS